MIPVHQPELGERETTLVLEALKAGEISGSFGHFITDFEQKFAEYCGVKYGVAVSSGSTALHLAMVIAGIEKGDEVLVSAFTNIATANAVAMQGGVVVPIDSEPDTWNMNPELLWNEITPRAKAIVPVHIYGHPVDMDQIYQIGTEEDLIIIEDAAEAHGATYNCQKVGSLGDMACFSFYANKVITTGEGGMIVTDSLDFAEQARSLRNLAFGMPRFLHNEIGYNYRMTNLQAAIGVAQLERIEETIAKKRQIAKWYSDRLSKIAGLQLPVEKNYARNVYWMYGIVVEPNFKVSRPILIEKLKAADIQTRTMFCPMNLQPALLEKKLVKQIPCPVAENLWKNGLYLPSGCQLTEKDIDVICEVIKCS